MSSGCNSFVEQSFPIIEGRGSNQVIDKIIVNIVYYESYWKDENKEKEAGNAPFL